MMQLDTYVANDEEALVFGTSTGNFLAVSNFNGTFRRAVEACDLSPHATTHRDAEVARALEALVNADKVVPICRRPGASRAG